MIEFFEKLTLDKRAGTPLYVQLYEKLKGMIQEGILLPAFKLPSVRQLAGILQVNQVTIVSAYKELENQGLVASMPGKGSFVRSPMYSSQEKRRGGQNPFSDEMYMQDEFPLVSNGQIKITENTLNFASATPTPDLFPVENFKVVINRVLDRDKGSAFGYQDSQGYEPMRESIASLIRKYGISASEESIQIISGAQQGIDILSKTLLRQDDVVLVESPTYTGAIAVFKSRGARIQEIEMDAEGPVPGVLEYNLKKFRPKILYAIPSFQNPTGCSWSNARRREIMKLAVKYETYIIEDDYVSDLDFEGKGNIPLKAMDESNRVIFIKSFSKIFMPGLRLGFMIVPSSLLGGVLEAKHTTDISTSELLQRAFDLYIREGFWDKHFSFMYGIYKERYLKTVEALNKYLPGEVSYNRPGGGLNLWLKLPYGFPVNSLIKHASAENLVFAPGGMFHTEGTTQGINHIRISFASVPTDRIEEGIHKLCGIIDSLLHRQKVSSRLPVL